MYLGVSFEDFKLKTTFGVKDKEVFEYIFS